MPIEKFPIKSHLDAEHRARRDQDLTCSDLAAWAGLDKFKTRLELFSEKTKRIDAPGDNAAMLRGRAHEPAVATYYRARFPQVELIHPVGWYYRDTECRLGGSPDAVASVPGRPGTTNVQLKVIAKHIFQAEWSDGPPLQYQLQTLGEMMLMEAEFGQLAVLVIDRFSDELHVFDVERNAGAEERIRELARTFWADVEADRQPPADYANDTDTIKALFPTSINVHPPLDLSGDNALPGALAKRERLKAIIKRAEGRIEIIDNTIKEKMRENERAALPGWAISWKTAHYPEKLRKAYSARPFVVTRKGQRP